MGNGFLRSHLSRPCLGGMGKGFKVRVALLILSGPGRIDGDCESFYSPVRVRGGF